MFRDMAIDTYVFDKCVQINLHISLLFLGYVLHVILSIDACFFSQYHGDKKNVD